MLADEYIKSGKVKLEVRHFPLGQHDPEATLGAQAAECAADQGAFWPYHDRLFSEASIAGANGFTMGRLVEYGRDLGLDDEQLSRCMVNQEQAQAIADSLAEGYAISVNSTPTVLINGQKMENPFDYQTLAAEIDRLLGETN